MNLSIDILRACPLFTSLNDNELSLIFDKLKKIELKEDEVLFRENDVDNALFILVSGRLVVYTEKKDIQHVIGFVRPGEVAGELSLFSNEPRAASIKAKDHSTLLCLKKSDFQSLCTSHPQLLWEISSIIAARCQLNIKRTKEYKPQIIAFLCIDDPDTLNSLISEIKNNDLKKLKLNIVETGKLKDSKSIHNSFKHAITQDHTALFFINYDALSTDEELLKIPEKVIFVMNERKDLESKTKSKIENILKIKGLDKELLLVHKKKAPWHPNTQQYLDLLQASRCYHTSFDAPITISRVLRFISGKAVGLVVSGGGAKGWAAVGAIRALYEKNIQFDYVAGTSIGAVLAALFAFSNDLEDFNRYLTTYESRPFSIRTFTLPFFSIFNGKNETQKLRAIFHEAKIQDLTLPYFCITTNLSTYQEDVWDEGFIWKAARASSSPPLLLPPLIDNAQIHVDGGVINNFPTDIMRNKLGHHGYIVGIDIGEYAHDPHEYDCPPFLTFSEALKSLLGISKEKLDCIGIGEIILRTMSTGSSNRYAQNYKNVDFLIQPPVKGFSFTDFTKKEALIAEGYREGTKRLKTWKEL